MYPSIAACLLAGPFSWSVENFLPTPFDAGRYADLKRRCPFALAVITPAPTASGSFAVNWYVSGLARLGDVDFVTVKARDLSSQFSLYGKEPNPENKVTLVSVQWVDGIGKSLVTIRKDNEIAQLEFNESQVRGPAPSTPASVKLANGKLPVSGLPIAPLASGAKPASLGGGGGSQQRNLRVIAPPTNLPTPVPTGTISAVHPLSQHRNGVVRPLPLRIPNTKTP